MNMSKSAKLYLFIIFISVISFRAFGVDSNIYENQVASTVCEGDTNIIKAGCSVAVGQVVRVTPGIVTGVTFDKMGECFNKYGPSVSKGQLEAKNVVIDLNDPCNQIATLNPEMNMSDYAFIPYDSKLSINNGRPSISSLATILEVTNKEATNGLLMNRSYALGETFKNVPYLKTSFAQSQQSSMFNNVTEWVFRIWQLSRNLAYLILLIGALFLGITIMIGNQTIDKDGKIRLTVEKAIPRVVLAVILISSSYWVGELVLNSLVGGGIIQSFASFFAKAVFPNESIPSDQFSSIIAYSAVILLMGPASALLSLTGSTILIPLLIAILAAVYKILLVNIFIAKNIIDLLIYIMISPFYIVGGVLPTENKSIIFKKYASSIIKFIINGFLLNLILYGSKSILLFGYLELMGINLSKSVISDIAKQNVALSNVVIYLFSLFAFIYVIGLANRTEGYADKLAQNLTGTKPDTESKKDK